VIRAQKKRVVRAIYAYRCGYCGVSEAQAGSELTFDHFRPRSQSGTDDVANLVYACHACNEFKGDCWVKDGNTRLLHPLTDDLTLHMAEEASGTFRALTTLGQVYVDRLQLNRAALIAHRQERQRLLRMESRLDEMTATLQSILLKMNKQPPGSG